MILGDPGIDVRMTLNRIGKVQTCEDDVHGDRRSERT